ncbi:MAG: hypothetical protein RJA07_55 [Bacteroidota bacterium]|jgi:hypothetical protein
MSDYTIRKLQTNEFKLLIPLMKNCFGMDVNIDYFEWKFKKNPVGFVEGFIAIAEDNEVAAYYGVIPELYLINGEQKTIYQSCDTMTHSNHRRKGLFQKLATLCYDSLRNENKLFIIGFGGGQSTPGFLKFGWQKIFDVRNYFYPYIFTIFRPLSDIKNIVEITNSMDIEKLILNSNASLPIHSIKGIDQFNWRLSNPFYNYKIIALKNNDGFNYDSYLVYYTSGDKIILFDFFFSNQNSANLLIGYIKNLLAEKKLKGIICFCQENSAYSKTLNSIGFISNPFNKGPLSEKTPFIFYSTDEKMNNSNHSKLWGINSFDHDAM